MTNYCNAPLNAQARLGIERFNRGEYWLAHAGLEDAWRDEDTPVGTLYKGILQVAVVFYHASQQNYQGAIKMYGRSQKWLKNWPAICCGIDVAHLRADLDIAIAKIKELGEENLADFDNYPKIIYEEEVPE
ncbi:MAG: DUF309 domain-containing protein [Anaerolineae bacterium]|jgi:predicted metal-dependent hydrolase|nr:DUF309 domain-containing protein [Anaerolineae bacterium]MBT7075150.1 DUF309 domain-containing protein [Anaerolineae bacterium]MBT7782269.1 DUF309 domain-containing protein [Anaerolineae bacterium]